MNNKIKYLTLFGIIGLSSSVDAQLYLCKQCDPGTYATAGAKSCSSCSAGTYQNISGQSSCKACSAGTYQNATGQTSCHACTGNTYSNAGASSCSSCSSGYVANASHTGCTQITCSSGQYINSAGTGCARKCTAQKSSLRYRINAHYGCNENIKGDNHIEKEISAGSTERDISTYTCSCYSCSNTGCGGGLCQTNGKITLKYNSSTGKMDVYKESRVIESIPAKDC